MCGIVGIFSLSGRPIDNGVERITKMTRMLKHRGPDQNGVAASEDGLCILGNTRLAIVDPLTKVRVPFQKSGQNEILSFNGEIYDHHEVRKRLEAKGSAFETNCDTEVLFEALKAEGDQVLTNLDGMWAFAFYTPKTRSLLLSRDIMGERHLFYQVVGEELLFSSEPHPILADQAYSQSLDYNSILSSFLFGVSQQGQTMMKEIKRMLPGHNIYAQANNTMREERYRKFHPEKWFDFFAASPSDKEVISKFQEVFDTSVKRRLPSDVPFFSTLSGGLDSTIISISASEYGQKRIRTLFGESRDDPKVSNSSELDEYAASKVTAEKYNLDQHYIQMNSEHAAPVLKHFAGTAFDGCVDPGVSSFAMLGKYIKELGSKVVLISDGPDELMGGYHVDKQSYDFDLMGQNEPLKFHALKMISGARTGRRILEKIGHGGDIIPGQYSYDPLSFVPVHQSTTVDFLRHILPEKDILKSIDAYGTLGNEYDDILPHMDYTQMRALSYACKSLPDIFNLRTDKAFLFNSVESRVPFQAPDMVDFLLAAPAKWRFGNGGTTKHLLRLIVEGLVGKQVSTRSKHGFSAPLQNTKAVYDQLSVEDTLRSSPVFEDFPFHKNSVEWLLDPQARKLRWVAYVMASTQSYLSSSRREAARSY